MLEVRENLMKSNFLFLVIYHHKDSLQLSSVIRQDLKHNPPKKKYEIVSDNILQSFVIINR